MKKILALSILVLLAPLQSYGMLSSSTSCDTCQKTWYSQGYGVCLSGCNVDRPRARENLLCRKGCTTKFQKLFSTCVEKIPLKPSNCSFKPAARKKWSRSSTASSTIRQNLSAGTWSRSRTASSTVRQNLSAGSDSDD